MNRKQDSKRQKSLHFDVSGSKIVFFEFNFYCFYYLKVVNFAYPALVDFLLVKLKLVYLVSIF